MTAQAKFFESVCLKFSEKLFHVCKPQFAGPHIADYSSDVIVSPHRFGTPGGCLACPPLRPTLETEINANGKHSSNNCICRRVRKISKSEYQLRHDCLSIPPSARNNSARPGRVFIKYDVRTFLETLPVNSFIGFFLSSPSAQQTTHTPLTTCCHIT